jgi:outer membrane receptor protein involved in Fe transport
MTPPPGGTRSWLGAVCCLLLAATAHAQVRVSGRTQSDTAAPVAGASVAARTPASNDVVARATSDAAGVFVLEIAATGEYRVSVQRQGFYAIEHQLMTLAPGTDVVLTLLPVREHLESLDVTSRGDPASLSQPSAEQVLSGAEAMNVPFNGSHGVKNALRTLPGVVQDGFGGIHVDGARESQTLFILDGFNVGDPLNGGFDPKVSVEAVQAITVRNGVYAAEYGKGSGGVIEVATLVGGDRLRYSATDFLPTVVREKGLRIQDWTPRLSASGPLVRQRAWFSNSFIGEYDQFFVEELPEGQDSSTSRRLSNHLRSQINLTAKNVIHAGVVGSSGVGRRLGLGPLDPVSTTRDARSHQWFANVRDQHVFASGAVLEAGYGANRTVLRLTPKGHDPFVSTPGGRRGNYYYDGRQDAARDQVIVNLYSPPMTWKGTHQFKAGTDLNRVAYRQDATRGHIELYDQDDRLIRSIAYLGSGLLSTTAGEVAAFVQDAWTVHARLALHLGVRVDWDSLTRDTTVSPRVMAAWAPSDGLKVTGGFAVTHDAARLQPFAAALDQSPVSIYAPPYGPGSLVLSRFVVGETLSSPGARTFTATLDRRLPAGINLHLQGLRRRGRHGLAYFGLPSADIDAIYTLESRRAETYDSGEIRLRQSFGAEYGWLVGYTRSSARSNAVLGNTPDSYFVAADNVGPLSWDTPHRVVTWAYLPTFRKPWSVSYLIEWRTGFPYSAADSAGFVVGAANARRFPDYFDLTLGLERRTYLFGQAWSLRASLSNLTNHDNPTSVNSTVESPDFGTFYGSPGRSLTGRIRWLGRHRKP